MIGHRDQDRVQEPALGRIRQAAAMQQKEHIGERRLLHQRRDVIAADPNPTFIRGADFRSPRLDHNYAHYQSETGAYGRENRCGFTVAARLRCSPAA